VYKVIDFSVVPVHIATTSYIYGFSFCADSGKYIPELVTASFSIDFNRTLSANGCILIVFYLKNKLAQKLYMCQK
jgi:hypothetical protein